MRWGDSDEMREVAILGKVYINGEYKGNVDLDEDDLRIFKEWSDYGNLRPNKIQDLSNLGRKPKWEHSRGCKAEVKYAKECGIPYRIV